MPLPQVDPSTLDIRPLDWSGVPEEHRARFLNPGEPEVLAALVRMATPYNPRKTMVEFGCQNGRTAKLLLDNVSTLTRYVGVDVPQNYITEKEVQREEVPPRPGELALDDPRFRLLLAGRGSQWLTPSDLGDVDVVFIDGDHSFRGVAMDTALAEGCMAPGGVIIWHDVHDLGTVDVSTFLEDYGPAIAGKVHQVSGTWIAFTRT